MKSYILSPIAQEDVAEILECVASRSPQDAARVAESLERAFERLAQWPNLGRLDAVSASIPLRLITEGNCIIAYDPATRPVGIA